MGFYVWGTGSKCRDLLNAGAFIDDDIEGFIETKAGEIEFYGKHLFSLSEVETFDLIIVTVKNNASIYENCLKKGIDLNKICFMYPCYYEKDSEKNLELGRIGLTKIGYAILQSNYGIHQDDWIKEDAELYRKINKRRTFDIDENYNYYIVNDKLESAGIVSSYFWQDLWAAKKIISSRPNRHYDIGSRIDGFITHLLAADISVEVIDIRPLALNVDNLSFVCADATHMQGVEDNSIESLSALCSLEHFGLGRYGDLIDPEACFKCFSAIQKKVKRGGDIYISVPIGKEHVEFNAHRIFYASTIVGNFDKCELVEFSSAKIDEFEQNIALDKYDEDASFGGQRFGLFHFRKK